MAERCLLRLGVAWCKIARRLFNIEQHIDGRWTPQKAFKIFKMEQLKASRSTCSASNDSVKSANTLRRKQRVNSHIWQARGSAKSCTLGQTVHYTCQFEVQAFKTFPQLRQIIKDSASACCYSTKTFMRTTRAAQGSLQGLEDDAKFDGIGERVN